MLARPIDASSATGAMGLIHHALKLGTLYYIGPLAGWPDRAVGAIDLWVWGLVFTSMGN